MNRVTVKIDGIDYNIKGEEDEQYLQSIGRYVDKKINEIMSLNPKLGTNAAAILTAINVVDEFVKEKEKYTKLIGQFSERDKEVKLLKDKYETVKQQYDILNSERESIKFKEIQEKAEENEKLEDEIKLLQKEVEAIKNRNSLLHEKNKQLGFDLRTYKLEQQSLKNKLQRVIDENVSLKHTLDPLKR